MRGRLTIALLLCLGAPRLAWADALGDVRARAAEVTALDGERAKLDARRAQLESDSQRLKSEIDRAKAEPAGVRRDARLQELLAQHEAAADELQKLASELRARSQSLVGARRALMGACDRALQTSLSESKRLELERLRTAQATLAAAPQQPLSVGKTEASALDGPRDLAEKADLLRDSEDKLKREVARLTLRIDDVERRRHLRERAGAVDDDVFGELTSNRHVAHSSNSAAGGAASNRSPTAGPAAGATPTNGVGGANGSGGATGAGGGAGQTPTGGGSVSSPAPSGPSFGFSGSDTAGKTSDTSTVLRNLVDPATLEELRRADGTDDFDRQVRALRRAQSELDGMARDLEKRARVLNQRAEELKHKK